MSRAGLTSGMITETEAATNAPFLMVQIDFGGSLLNLWTGAGDIVWNSITWLGNGWLRGINGMAEMDDLSAPNCDIELAGVPNAIVSLALNAQQGRPVKVYLGFLNSSGAVITSPYELWRGKLDVPIIKEGDSETIITIQCESVLIQNERLKEYRYNTETQKIFYPSDVGFAYVSSVARQELFWGNRVKTKKQRETNNMPKNALKQRRNK